MPLTPEQRKIRAKIAANSRWARPGSREEQAEAARRALLDRFARQVDPAGVLPEAERERLVASALRAHSQRMHLARARVDGAAAAP